MANARLRTISQTGYSPSGFFSKMEIASCRQTFALWLLPPGNYQRLLITIVAKGTSPGYRATANPSTHPVLRFHSELCCSAVESAPKNVKAPQPPLARQRRDALHPHSIVFIFSVRRDTLFYGKYNKYSSAINITILFQTTNPKLEKNNNRRVEKFTSARACHYFRFTSG